MNSLEQQSHSPGSLQGRSVLLGVSGGIAAYKTPILVRGLIAEGADVRVVLTRAAGQFVAGRTLETLSRHPVYTGVFDATDEFPVLHIGLAEWADLVVVAPATAHLIGKVAAGLGDDLLTTLLLASSGSTLMAPSMEEGMWLNPVVQRNCRTLAGGGYLLIDPEEGELASGGEGTGRMPEPQEMVRRVVGHFAQDLAVGPNVSGDLEGMHLLVTAGPTVEDLDPVRFISNRSTGKMGYAVAQRARERGAEVSLVTGPTTLPTPPGVRLQAVRSTLQMKAAVDGLFDQVDAVILAAAVADYRAAQVAEEKVRRGSGSRAVELVENPDIAADLGARRQNQVLVAFAMETEDGEARAREKLRKKKCDLIVLNNLRDEGAGFGVDTNVVTMIDADGGVEALEKMPKLAVADRILDRVVDLRGGRL